ncbi:MAG TPA: hypothetical protein PL048_16910 [Leptospiraceae bacterium]|nr:hypothetical protein [Leptospiraceae bacterium]HMY65328.1 hypothetical protein [Leptospiraceae bacterium]HMZ60461.1 hypothetical protein [Leptospiraceae bacterium]HNI95190.1 hypothetical protein [Leptospiraceae bacterium]
MKKIKLSRGKVALVDDEDYARLNEYRWYINENAEKTKLYAMRSKLKEENLPGTKVYMHRFILNVKDKSVAVKHKNGNTLDNRRDNLYSTKRKLAKKK